MALDPEQIQLLLQDEEKKPSRKGTRTKRDVTEPREVTTWFRLPHRVADFVNEAGEEVTPHCENPDCDDPRPGSDRGRNVIAIVNGKMMCRYCFLAGWLSDAV